MSGQFLSSFFSIPKLISFVWNLINLAFIALIIFLYIKFGLNWEIKFLSSFLVVSYLLSGLTDTFPSLISLYRKWISLPEDIEEIKQINDSRHLSDDESKNINFMFLIVERLIFQKSLDKLVISCLAFCLYITIIIAIWNSNFLDLVLSTNVEFINFLIKLWNSKFWQTA